MSVGSSAENYVAVIPARSMHSMLSAGSRDVRNICFTVTLALYHSMLG